MEKETPTHSSILAWKIPWTDKPSGLQFMGMQRVGHDLETKQQQLAPLGNEGHRCSRSWFQEVLGPNPDIVLPGRPSHCSVLDKHPNIQLCFMSEDLGSPGKAERSDLQGASITMDNASDYGSEERSDLRTKALKMSLNLNPGLLDSQVHDSLGQNSFCFE